MQETILILGCDGYIGWNLMMYLGVRNKGLVVGVDNFSRRNAVAEVGSDSLTQIQDIHTRIKTYKEVFKKDNMTFVCGNLLNAGFVYKLFEKYRPSTIIHLAQQPSAPYSMMNNEKAVWTTKNNVLNNLNVLWAMKDICPNAHLIKMGTMGEYGTPNIDIPEGFFEVEFRGRKDVLPFPKQAGSFYHWAKTSESNHTMFACKIWGLKATDLMQGIVFGASTEESKKDEKLISRFDYDECFGTVINRFVVQAMSNIPLTVYGKGKHVRGLINIKDALKCFELYINNPPAKGEYRVFNQLAEQEYNITQLAEIIVKIGRKHGFNPIIKEVVNPRIEAEEHYYKVDTQKLKKLGFKITDMKEEISQMFIDLKPYIHRIKPEVVMPKVSWK